jgi:acyl-CoA reductase-like NAD-dependent aldehyde dehydrogenase
VRDSWKRSRKAWSTWARLLVERAMAESGLPKARLEGERGRTVGQLRLFAEVVRAGRWLDVTIDRAQPARLPARRPDMRLRNIAVGPVAVFGASNFPLAFSVAGGDTASALAAGCPVVVKAHPGHLGTSELVGRVVQAAVKACGCTKVCSRCWSVPATTSARRWSSIRRSRPWASPVRARADSR